MEGVSSQITSEGYQLKTTEGPAAIVSPTASASNTNEQNLLREIVEEEKLDEQAAKKEEIEAAEDEEAGIMP